MVGVCKCLSNKQGVRVSISVSDFATCMYCFNAPGKEWHISGSAQEEVGGLTTVVELLGSSMWIITLCLELISDPVQPELVGSRRCVCQASCNSPLD